jgi:hypothetical protein
VTSPDLLPFIVWSTCTKNSMPSKVYQDGHLTRGHHRPDNDGLRVLEFLFEWQEALHFPVLIKDRA